MMMTPEIVSALGARFFQYTLSATLPSTDGSLQALPQEQIQAGFHFFSELLNITYNTLVDDDGDPVDDGVCHFTAQFKSGSNQIGLSNGFIDLSTIAAPGRQRTQGVTGDPSNSLHIDGFPWPYFYEATGSIIVDLRKEDTGQDESVTFVFTGWLIPVERCRTALDFYNILAQQYPNFGSNPDNR